jgi:CBS domain
MTATLSTATSLERLFGTVGEAMTAKVVALQGDTPADVATRRLEHLQVSGAPVVDHGRVVGVVTLRDLLAPVLADGPVQTTGPFHRHEQHLTNYRVRELMTAEPVCARADSPLARGRPVHGPGRCQPDPGGRRGRPPRRHPHPRRRAARPGPAHPKPRSRGRRRVPDGTRLTPHREPGRGGVSARLLFDQESCWARRPAAPSSTASSSPHRWARSASPAMSGPIVPWT